MKSRFMEANMSEKNEEKKIDNDPVLVFIISLPRNKNWTVIQGLYNWDPLSSLCFATFLFLGRKLRVTSSIWNYVSEAYLVAYAALYCGPIVNQSYLDKIWFVSPTQCLRIVRGTSKRILCKEGLKNVYNLLGSFLLTSRCEKYYIN